MTNRFKVRFIFLPKREHEIFHPAVSADMTTCTLVGIERYTAQSQYVATASPLTTLSLNQPKHVAIRTPV